jgi:hypothetical protein
LVLLENFSRCHPVSVDDMTISSRVLADRLFLPLDHAVTDAAPGSHREGRLSKEVHVTFDKLSDIRPAEAALARERLFFPWDHEYWRPNRSAGVEGWHEKQMRDLESQTEYFQRRFTSSNNNNSALAVDYPRKIANQPEMSGKRVWLRGLAANIQPSSAYTVVQEMCGGTAHPDLEALSKELSDRSASSMDSGLLPVAEDGVLKLPPYVLSRETPRGTFSSSRFLLARSPLRGPSRTLS